MTISTNFGNDIVFLYKNGRKVALNGDLTPKNHYSIERGSIDKEDLTYIQAFINTMTREESRQKFYVRLEAKYGTLNPEFLSQAQGKELVSTLKGTK